MHHDDTIVAISSPVAPAARIIVRLSGQDALVIARGICSTLPDTTASAHGMAITVGEFIIPASLYIFLAPRSYSGEDIVEMHIPGNPIIARKLLELLMRSGARPAEPGEFTARALFNGRMDLSAAEGVAAVISAVSDRELQAARQLMAGQLARRLRPIMDQIVATLALVEVGIDFSDEDVTVLAESELHMRIDQGIDALDDLLSGTSRFEQLVHEPRIALVGRPNAGKSTLLNALAGSTRAVVSNLPGTTRDALSVSVNLQRGRIQLVDLAGLDSSRPAETDSTIASDMQRRACEELERADLLLLVQDCMDYSPPLRLSRLPDLVIYSKSDLVAGEKADEMAGGVAISVHRGEGLDILRERLDELCFGGTSSPSLALNARHVHALENAREAMRQIIHLDQPELIAIYLREALDLLGTILGKVTPDELIGQVFSRFCIGK